MQARFLILLLISLTLVRCHDTETFVPDPVPSAFKASAFVEVKDIQGNPLENVRIQVGNTEGFTDKEGLLYLRNVNVHAITYLEANKEGYFHGSRRFYPSAGQTHHVRLILLNREIAGTITSSIGGDVQVSAGIHLHFPADAIVDKNGEVYSGTVSVMAQPISADDPDLSYKMPGDLVGISEEGKQGVLGSFGMMVVELESPSGEPLQVKAGSTVEMSMEIPSSMISAAPSTIPMWYFDEELGFWKEEGEATLTGNLYVAQLGHFSYWNCDAWFDLVKWGATFNYEDGSPASQVTVCLTILDLQTTACAVTNDEGLVCGMVAANELMLMEVKSPCGDVIYSQQIGPYSDTTMIGPITIPTSSVTISAVSGNAINCTGDPVTNGFAKLKVGDQNYFAELDAVSGAFSISVVNCDATDLQVSVVDVAGFKQSLPFVFSYAPVIDAGTITVCETITEFMDFEVVGFTEHFYFFFPDVFIQGGMTTLIGQDSSSQGQFCYIKINGETAGTYTPAGAEVGVTLPNGDRAFASANDITVTITYFGDVGDYIIGTISGTWHTGPNGQGGPDYPLLGTFSILRE